MRAPVIRVVQHEHVAGPHGACVFPDHRLDALAHRPQMNRHVRRIGNQVALCVKQGAAEVKALLDVDRVRRVLQLQPHLLGNIHEQIVENLQQHRICCGSRCIFNRSWRMP